MVSFLQDRSLTKSKRGDQVNAVESPGRRVTTSFWLCLRPTAWSRATRATGFTLIELVISVTVLTILTLGVVPLIKLSVKRQKEDQLRSALRQMRTAIDEFHRDTVNMPRTGLPTQSPPQIPPGQTFIDPRSKVVISDPTIFGVDNADLYPPNLETLVSGVNVIPRAGNPTGAGDPTKTATEVGNGQLSTKKKVYLRSIPIDPMTGKADWCVRSCYDAPGSGCSGGEENVFDIHSKSEGTALNGEKYSDW